MNSDSVPVDSYILSGRSPIIIGEKLWLLTSETDMLIKINLEKDELENYYLFPEKINASYQHISMSLCNNKIYIFPLYGENMYIFDIEEECLKKFELPIEYGIKGKAQSKFRISTVFENKVFFLGQEIPGLYYYDDKMGMINKYDRYLNDLENLQIDIYNGFSSEEYQQIENVLYVPIYNTDILLCFSLDEPSHRVLHLRGAREDFRIRTVCREGDKIIVTGVNDNMMILQNENICEERDIGLLDSKDSVKCYYKVCADFNTRVFFPHYEKSIFVEIDGEIKRVEFPYTNDIRYPDYVTSQFDAVFKYKKNLYFQHRGSSELMCYDYSTGNINLHKIQSNTKQLNEIKKSYYYRLDQDILMENNPFGIEDYLSLLQ